MYRIYCLPGISLYDFSSVWFSFSRVKKPLESSVSLHSTNSLTYRLFPANLGLSHIPDSSKTPSSQDVNLPLEIISVTLAAPPAFLAGSRACRARRRHSLRLRPRDSVPSPFPPSFMMNSAAVFPWNRSLPPDQPSASAKRGLPSTENSAPTKLARKQVVF